MLTAVFVLILAAPATPLAPATKPPSSRDVGRLVNEAATVEDALATARLLPRAGEETQHWETQDVHIARRRKSLTALLRRVEEVVVVSVSDRDCMDIPHLFSIRVYLRWIRNDPSGRRLPERDVRKEGVSEKREPRVTDQKASNGEEIDLEVA